MAIKELIGDIYTLMESREVHQDTTLEEQAALFGKECEQIMLSVLSPTEPRTGALRLSGIGKPPTPAVQSVSRRCCRRNQRLNVYKVLIRTLDRSHVGLTGSP